MVGNSISCIVITNGLNNKFLTERTLSSIMSTTNHIGWQIELIVVDNSPNQNVKDILLDKGYLHVLNKRINIIKSKPNHLPKAFNIGVKNSNSKYVALFHDDCEVLDDTWVKNLTSHLTNKVYMVGPELHSDIEPLKIIKQKKYLKEVPVVLEREKFLEIGGYDETYYWGFEDVMFSTKILNLGKQIKKVPIRYNHFNGMSTILLQKKYLSSQNDFKNTQDKFVKMLNRVEFENFKKNTMGHIKVKIKEVIQNPLLKLLLFFLNFSTNIKITKNIGVNLGYIQLCRYWKTTPTKVPTEVLVGLMPKTQKDIDLLMEDIKQQKDGELYGKLEKYKGKIFRDYFETISR